MTQQIIFARAASDYAAARGLIEEYAAAPEVAVCVQNLAPELTNLALIYGAPRGALALLEIDGAYAGCIALRERDADTAELKRLYVRPVVRGAHWGRRLTETALQRARALGYRCVVLETLPTMRRAQALYRALGFLPAPAGDHPAPGGIDRMVLALPSLSE